MKKSEFQFHATNKELIEFIKQTVQLHRFYLVKIKLFTLEIEQAGQDLSSESFKGCHMIFLFIDKPECLDASYQTFIKMNKDYLQITIGEETEMSLKASSMCVMAESQETLKIGRKIINDFKKQLFIGAWCIHPYQNGNVFYKNHYYTQNAYVTYKNGKKLTPLKGWAYYKLGN